MKTHRAWFATALVAAVVALGIAAGIGTANAESNGGVRVMPLGDSITEGTQVPGGYRIGLWQRVNGRRVPRRLRRLAVQRAGQPRRPRPRGPPRLADRPDRRQHRRLAAASSTRERCCCTSAPTTCCRTTTSPAHPAGCPR